MEWLLARHKVREWYLKRFCYHRREEHFLDRYLYASSLKCGTNLLDSHMGHQITNWIQSNFKLCFALLWFHCEIILAPLFQKYDFVLGS